MNDKMKTVIRLPTVKCEQNAEPLLQKTYEKKLTLNPLQITSLAFFLTPVITSVVFYEKNIRYTRLMTVALFLTSISNHQRPSYGVPIFDSIDNADRVAIVGAYAAGLYDFLANPDAWSAAFKITLYVFLGVQVFSYLFNKVANFPESYKIFIHGFALHLLGGAILTRLTWE